MKTPLIRHLETRNRAFLQHSVDCFFRNLENFGYIWYGQYRNFSVHKVLLWAICPLLFLFVNPELRFYHHRRAKGSLYQKLTHHPVIFVFQQMTMIHVQTGVIVKAGNKAHTVAGPEQHGVFPSPQIGGRPFSIDIKNEKLDVVEMKTVGLIHHTAHHSPATVLNFPDLRTTELHPFVDTIHIHFFPVDGEPPAHSHIHNKASCPIGIGGRQSIDSNQVFRDRCSEVVTRLAAGRGLRPEFHGPVTLVPVRLSNKTDGPGSPGEINQNLGTLSGGENNKRERNRSLEESSVGGNLMETVNAVERDAENRGVASVE